MIDVLVEHAEAFLEQFSISRITMGNIVSFINLLELENTKAKLAQTLKTIKVRDFLYNLVVKVPEHNNELVSHLNIGNAEIRYTDMAPQKRDDQVLISYKLTP